MKILVIGLDCLGPEVLSELADTMPNLNALARGGSSGVLESTLPPITVPAWTSMLSGRDPGELGLYGFRNRSGFGYDALRYADARHVRAPRLWDRVAQVGRPSIVVGVPQTSPVPEQFEGVLVCGFEGPLDPGGRFTTPPEVEDEIRALVGAYIFDVGEFRSAEATAVRDEVHRMTERRFAVMRHLLATRPWDFAMIHEIGPDRMHHIFWRDHDPRHPRHVPGSPFGHFIVDYYRLLDRLLGELVAMVPADTAVLIASDHGATAMHGAIAVNELLLRAGLLVLREAPASQRSLTADMVDWPRTSAWAEGGYYARVFLNIAGREPQGAVMPDDVPFAIARVREALGRIDVGGGRILRNRVVEPRELYRRVRGIPPDLMVFFEGESWRSVSAVGTGRIWLEENDKGADNANHARAGMYALFVPGRPPGGRQDASILDVAPTLLSLLGLESEPGLSGRDILSALPELEATA
jgi:predicted AlkP superfamily phosphohydrolase/phosphomutase